MKKRSFRRQIDSWQPFSNLHGFVQMILLVDWDPIGILGEVGAMDEYDSYASGVCTLLRSGEPQERLVKHLAELEQLSMGLTQRNTRDLDAVADKLLAVYRALSRRGDVDSSE